MSVRRVVRGVVAFALTWQSLACQPALGPVSAGLLSSEGTFTDETGRAVSLESFRGSPLVVTAIFTSCTVRCPLTVQKLHEVDDAFGRAGVRVPIVILTLDPHTDTIERLQRFKAERKLPDHWHLIRGSDRDTQSLARKLLVHAAYDVGHIDHDVRIAVLDRDGKITRSFSGWSFDAGSAVVQ